jgi:two-component system, OmpR family, response regulator
MTYKLLIVDDEKDTVDMLKDIFEAENYEVETANDGPECLEKLENYTPDMILLDIMMPKMNGWMLFLNLQKNPKLRKIPVMVISAKPLSEESQNKVTLLGVKDYIIKPFDIQTLTEKVKEIIEEIKKDE